MNVIVSLGVGVLIFIVDKRQSHYLDEIIQAQHKMTQEIHKMLTEEIRLIHEMARRAEASFLSLSTQLSLCVKLAVVTRYGIMREYSLNHSTFTQFTSCKPLYMEFFLQSTIHSATCGDALRGNSSNKAHLMINEVKNHE